MGLVEQGDTILIDIPGRILALEVDAAELAVRRARMDASAAPWTSAEERPLQISKALRAYPAFTASADKGGVRLI